jgi:hypothetical protein
VSVKRVFYKSRIATSNSFVVVVKAAVPSANVTNEDYSVFGNAAYSASEMTLFVLSFSAIEVKFLYCS